MKLFGKKRAVETPDPSRMIKDNLGIRYLLMWGGIVALILGLGAWYWNTAF